MNDQNEALETLRSAVLAFIKGVLSHELVLYVFVSFLAAMVWILGLTMLIDGGESAATVRRIELPFTAAVIAIWLRPLSTGLIHAYQEVYEPDSWWFSELGGEA
jgi:hypothetical protein